MMARRMMRKHHVRCRAGEKVEITSKPYLSLSIIIECGKMLVRHGYKVKVLNTINFPRVCIITRSTISIQKRYSETGEYYHGKHQRGRGEVQ